MKSGILFLLAALLYPTIGYGNANTAIHSTAVGEFNAKGLLVEQPAMAMAAGKKYGAEISITGLKGRHTVSIDVIPPDAASKQTPGTTRISRVKSSAIIDFKDTPRTYGTGAYTLIEGQPSGDYRFKFYIDGNLVAQRSLCIR